jgi:hypothetical protein
MRILFDVSRHDIGPTSGIPYISRALKLGLLRLVIMYATSDTDNGTAKENKIYTKISKILEQGLRAALVNYTVVLRLHEVFQDALELAAAHKLGESKYAKHWDAFFHLVTGPHQHFDRLRSKGQTILQSWHKSEGEFPHLTRAVS